MKIKDLTHQQRTYILGSDRYSIRNTHIHDDILGRSVTADDIVENMAER